MGSLVFALTAVNSLESVKVNRSFAVLHGVVVVVAERTLLWVEDEETLLPVANEVALLYEEASTDVVVGDLDLLGDAQVVLPVVGEVITKVGWILHEYEEIHHLGNYLATSEEHVHTSHAVSGIYTDTQLGTVKSGR